MKKANIDETLVITMYLDTFSARDVAERFGVSSETVYRVLKRNGVKIGRGKYREPREIVRREFPTDQQVIETYKRNGYNQKATARELGTSEQFIRNRIDKYNLPTVNGGTPIKVTDEQLRELVNAGLTRQQIASFTGMHVESLPRRLRRLGLSTEYGDAKCVMCGRRFKSYHNTQTYCKACQDEYLKDSGYRKRCRKFGVYFDPSVSRDKVIERDKGICQICGIKCDPDDKSWGSYGAKYPTLDHIRPLAKGGTHTWDNVQCACAMCNSVKRDIV